MSRRHEDYRIAWICALPIELAAATCLLDDRHPPLPQPRHDHNSYRLGSISEHNIVIACLPAGSIGLNTCRNIDFGLMVGVGGGVPSAENDIRLGDVVVSYMGRARPGRFERTGSLDRPPMVLLSALSALQAMHMMEGSRMDNILRSAIARYPKFRIDCAKPDAATDVLFRAEYSHPPRWTGTCSTCDTRFVVRRTPRANSSSVVHYGLVGSGNQVIRDGITREALRSDLNLLCVEMEAAGLMNNSPCLVIRGICDYADSHKQKLWQPYAACTAAAFAKDLLSHVPSWNNKAATSIECARSRENRPGPMFDLRADSAVSSFGQQHRGRTRTHSSSSWSRRPAADHSQDTALSSSSRFDSLRQCTARTEASNSTESSPPRGRVSQVSPHAQWRSSVSKVSPNARWATAGWFDQDLEFEGFCVDLDLYHGDTLNNMMADTRNNKLCVVQFVVHARSRPFAFGETSQAHYAKLPHSDKKFVLKDFQQPDNKDFSYLVEEMQQQALCKSFALEFNGLVQTDHPLDFVTTICLQGTAGARKDDIMFLEPLIDTTNYVRYNSNGYYVLNDDDDPFNVMAQAFSHFTFERSFGNFLVVNIQGYRNTLTDPAIHTKEGEKFKLLPTNLHEEGFKFFFALHKCNAICGKLQLKSNKDMMLAGSFKFREIWPTMQSTVFCASKLCRKIIGVATAKNSSKFPERRWCDDCFPWLEKSTSTQTCREGPVHHFEASGFFYESQGRRIPTRCPDHVQSAE
ncbi:hypothetical protein KVT40_002915 [Elsinoe batatas]|uniref:Alpha-type protein kinase domain-containing protein n=1 Tax=Elsinoe batatas TaxID=2601811 RepID=A0A8K0L7S5_9PEZI|nr:hypothetical protein KVT40_002915 [Elsinoe batatas]